MPETPRTWVISTDSKGYVVWDGPNFECCSRVELIELDPLLDLLGHLIGDDASAAYSAAGEAEKLLRAHGRLPDQEKK